MSKKNRELVARASRALEADGARRAADGPPEDWPDFFDLGVSIGCLPNLVFELDLPRPEAFCGHCGKVPCGCGTNQLEAT